VFISLLNKNNNLRPSLKLSQLRESSNSYSYAYPQAHAIESLYTRHITIKSTRNQRFAADPIIKGVMFPAEPVLIQDA
jgi:hypothetical protein